MNVHLEFVAADNPTVAFENSIQQAANILDSMFTDNVTINLTVGYGEVNGEILTNGEAAAGPDLTGGAVQESYSTVRNLLTADAAPGDSTFAFLPAGSSINGQSTVTVFTSQEKLFGQISATGTEIDGGAGFATDIPSNDLVAVALHELTHAMGRTPDNENGFSAVPDIFDFTDFTGGGARLFTDSVPSPSSSYFSLNDGFTKWADYGVNSDPSDFLNFYSQTNSNGTDVASIYTPEDAFDQYYDSSTLHYMTPVDLEQMDALGYHLKQDSPASDSYDFNGENSGDILLQNAAGKIEYGNMAGGIFQGIINVANTPGYTVMGQGKISGGADADVVVENSGGQILYADLVNGAMSHWVMVANAPNFNAVGVGDINDDHYADVVVENSGTGQVLYANMSGGAFAGWVNVATVPGWNVVGVGDMNYDGFADVVIQSQSTGQIDYANMDNGVFSGWGAVATSPGWTAVGVGDITRTGWDSVVIQNQSSDQIVFANMTGGTFDGWVNVGTPFGWNVIGVEDVLGNGFADIVIQDGAGDIDYANMTGGSFQGWANITTVAGFTGRNGPAGDQGGAQVTGGLSILQIGGAPPAGPTGDQGGAQVTGGLSILQIGGASAAGATSAQTSGDNGQSASWLNQGLQLGATSNTATNQGETNSQVGIVTADSLHAALQLGT